MGQISIYGTSNILQRLIKWGTAGGERLLKANLSTGKLFSITKF